MTAAPRLRSQPSPAVRGPEPPAPSNLLRTIGADGGRRGFRRASGWLLAAAVAGSTGWIAYDRWTAEPAPIEYRTAAVSRGDLQVAVSATGNLQAHGVVSVGGEISGRVASVEVDFNDRVQAGQVLLRLDTQLLRNAVAEAEAAYAMARTELARAKASRAQAESVARRTADLAARGLVPAEENESAQSAAALARADVDRAGAALRQAGSRVEQAKTNLDKAEIVSPIDGVVLSRTVEPGNAIAASLSAPELFILAEDLARMELHLGIDEADVGRVREGQRATFTVDAFPGRTFDATVEQVRLSPAASDTVVTYTAVLSVRNDEALLRPGMTATASIVTARHEDLLRVPNAALRFSPAATQPGPAESATGNPFRMMGPRMRGGRGGAAEATEERSSSGGGTGSVWVLREGTPTRIELDLGPSDGRFTGIEPGALAEGDELLVGADREAT